MAWHPGTGIVLRVALVVSQGGVEGGFAEQFPLDVEKDRPQGGVVAVGHEVPCMHYEIRVGVLEDRGDDRAMDVMPRARIAIDHKLKLRRSGWGRLEAALSRVAAEGIVVVGGPRAQAGEIDSFGVQGGSSFFDHVRRRAESCLAALDQ